MRILYIYAHPAPESFHGAIRAAALEGLAAAGHDIDLIDLYADGFDPVIDADQRRRYHDTTRNTLGMEDYIARLRRADALIFQFPTWTFGPPAILKGFLDRMMIPGVAFDLSNPGNVRSLLGHIRRVEGIVTYGRQRWVAMVVGDGPRNMVTRYLRRLIGWRTRVRYHALYHMNVATDADRARFLARVRKAMESIKD